MRIAYPAALLAALLIGPSAAGAGSLAMKEEAGLRWVCGGVGADERRELGRLGAESNLEILFVSARRGGYLSGAQLLLQPAGATVPSLQVEADGPICHVDAPAGLYRVQARLGGIDRAVTVRVPPRGARSVRAVLAFPEEPWDGIRASDEEKRQARAS
jgi:hypothetical protein